MTDYITTKGYHTFLLWQPILARIENKRSKVTFKPTSELFTKSIFHIRLPQTTLPKWTTFQSECLPLELKQQAWEPVMNLP